MVRTRRASSVELVEDEIARVLDFANVGAEEELQAILKHRRKRSWKELKDPRLVSLFDT